VINNLRAGARPRGRRATPVPLLPGALGSAGYVSCCRRWSYGVDRTAKGLTLLGGRLDDVDGKPTAAIAAMSLRHPSQSMAPRRHNIEKRAGKSLRSLDFRSVSITSSANAIRGSRQLATSDSSRTSSPDRPTWATRHLESTAPSGINIRPCRSSGGPRHRRGDQTKENDHVG
jgi:hypothetical protein